MPLSSLQQLLADRLGARKAITIDDPALSQAGVAVVVGSNPDSVLIIRRAERSGDPWSGHMGFPGGRRSGIDEHLLATAIRETEEEVGLSLSRSNLLGVLDDVAPRSPTAPSVFARPYVFAVEGHPPVSPNHEVSGAYWISINILARAGIFREFEVKIGDQSRTFPAYHLDEGVVWGMTERMLTTTLGILGIAPPA